MQVRLGEIYSNDELFDESEALGRLVCEVGGEILEDSFEVRSLAPAEQEKLRSASGGMPVLEAFRAHARPAQKKRVRDLSRQFGIRPARCLADEREDQEQRDEDRRR